MDKDIEKRARDYVKGLYEGWENPDIIEQSETDYIEGATDQIPITKKEMIEKAKHCFCKVHCNGQDKDNCEILCSGFRDFAKYIEN